MDFKILKKDLEDKLFTDLTLILCDNNDTITLDVHKIVLYCSCVYFQKLLTFGKTIEKIIKINVPNVYISKDIIRSFYNKVWDDNKKCFIQIGKPDSAYTEYPEWKYKILLHKCNDFFGLDVDFDKIYYLKVPNENFSELLDFVDLLGYDNESIQLLVNNFPLDYDLINLSKELLIAILEKLKLCCFTTLSRYDEIKIWNNGSNDKIIDNTISKLGNNKIYCTPDESKIIYVGYDSIQYINIDEHKSIIFPNEKEYINTAKNINFVYISADKSTLATIHGNCTKIWNTEKGTLINTLPLNWDMFSASISSKGNYIVVHKYNDVREIWDCKNGKIVSVFDKNNNKWCETSNISLITSYDISLHAYRVDNCYYHNNMCFSPDDSKIAMVHGHNVKIFNLESGELIKSRQIHLTDEIDNLIYSPEGDKIMYYIIGKKIKIWNLSTNDLLESKYRVSVAYFYPDGKHIIYAFKNNIYLWDIQTNKIVTSFESDSHIDDLYPTSSLNKDLINKIEKFIKN
ncbi:WD40 repeat protein [Moumouvirus australiensis]|uniref:WD40 repeat protein n=1 Tax=Moumouvirus australiensis TaxID=2109587 RepID=A0A2P1EN08_9VIRU|nr:WD40 repeat protein [Moumouvirus australiensis]AVL95240.1 WD40 repeat protein [Moumouvirus australiensis]